MKSKMKGRMGIRPIIKGEMKVNLEANSVILMKSGKAIFTSFHKVTINRYISMGKKYLKLNAKYIPVEEIESIEIVENEGSINETEESLYSTNVKRTEYASDWA